MQRAEQQIEQGELTGEVLVDRLGLIGVMPMVEYRRGEYPSQGADVDAHFGMNKQRLPAKSVGKRWRGARAPVQVLPMGRPASGSTGIRPSW